MPESKTSSSSWALMQKRFALACGSQRRVYGLLTTPITSRGSLRRCSRDCAPSTVRRARAALVTLIDVPFVSASTVRRLISVYRERGAPIVRPVSNGRHGHPVIFGCELFDELQRADPAQGAKPVVRAHAAEMIEVPVDDEGAFTDIDTREDYERVIGPFPKEALWR